VPRIRQKDAPAASASPAASAASAAAAGRALAVRLAAGRRGKLLGSLAVAIVLCIAVSLAWRRLAPRVAQSERYLLHARDVSVSAPPEWLVADVRRQVVHSSGIDGRLSVLDANFFSAVEHAFTLHPWVKSVDRIEKRAPHGVHVELTYRQPVAVVVTARGELLPVDAGGLHLPAEDVPLIRRQYLPRIANIVGQPPIGQPWEDPRIPGAVDLVVSLAGAWEALRLTEVYPSARPEIQGDRQYFVYDLLTRGGTKIVWGAAPSTQAPGEAAFQIKLKRLEKCVEQYGPLDTVKGPGSVNVRGELTVEPRLVKKPKPEKAPPTHMK
jgi:hypothetical protein